MRHGSIPNLTLYLKITVMVGAIAISQPYARSQAVDAVSKTSFDAVTERLDKGGDFYMYLSTAEWLQSLFSTIDRFSAPAKLQAKTDADAQRAMEGLALFKTALATSGLGEVSGVGISSIPASDQMHHNKFYLHRYPTDNPGKVWQLLGDRHDLAEGLRWMPPTTAYASYGSFDIGMFWTWLNDLIRNSDSAEWNEAWQSGLAGITNAGVDPAKLFESVGAKNGCIFTVNDERTFPYQLKDGREVVVPDMGFVIFAKVRNPYIFDLIDERIQGNPNVEREDSDSLKLRAIPLPLPLPVVLKPTIAVYDGYLLIASNVDLLRQVIAVQKGERPGIATTDEYKNLQWKLPNTGSGFKFLSRRLSENVATIVTSIADNPATSEEDRLFLDMISDWYKNGFFLSVAENTDTGYVVTANSNQSVGKAIPAQMMVAPTAIVAGMMLPALSKAREKARRINCAGNLKQIGLGCLMYSGEHNGNFPERLGLLSEEGYLQAGKVWGCPSAEIECGTADTTNYTYVGNGLRDDVDAPQLTIIAYDNPTNHPAGAWINVLFVDGHVQGFPMSDIESVARQHGLNLDGN